MNLINDFKKFPSLENTYQTKLIHLVEDLGFDKQDYIVTEKVHGANFSFWLSEEVLSVEGIGLCSTVVVNCAKRSGWIADDEKFFNYKPVLSKYRDRLEKLYYRLVGLYDCTDVVVYGELFGGNIQNGMCYPEDQDFVAFDLCINSNGHFTPLSKKSAFEILKEFDLPIVPVLGVYDSLQEALNFNEYFESKLISDNFKGVNEHKESEGVVIEPVNPCWFPNGGRVYFKKKTKRFLEKGGNKIKKVPEELSKELEEVLTEVFEYINESRFNSVVSKIGEVNIKDIGKVMGLMTQDILIDARKDGIDTPENKKFMKLLQTEVQNFIRPILLNR